MRLQEKYRAFLTLELKKWEDEGMRATESFQDQIIPPSQTDIVVCILWAKIGTRLPENYRRPDGTVPTGTEWEFEDAYAAYRSKGTPDLLVYRNSAPPKIEVTSDEMLKVWQQQKAALDAFLNHWFRDHEGAFKAAFNSFATEAQFEEKLEKHLEGIIKRKINRTDDPITWFQGSPFRGLNVFQPEHAPIFFGRELEVFAITRRLVEQAARNRVFLAVLGMSGCGKSSLIRAGVLPEIKKPGVVPHVGCWRHAILRPRDVSGDLVDGLAATLVGETSALPEFTALRYNGAALAGLLRDAPTHAIPPLHAALEQVGEAAGKAALRDSPLLARLLLVVDQFEEIFTLDRFTPAQRKAFIAALAVLSRSGLVWVVVTMRSDLYSRCAEIPELIELKGDDGQFDLGLPDVPELGAMIRSPARAAGLRYEAHPVTQQPLDEALQKDAGRNPAGLPLLEFCLDELYKLKTASNLLTWAAYEQLGRLEGAVTKRAEDVFNGLSPAAQAALPPILSALIVMGETATARPAARAELERHPGGAELVDAYVRASLLVTDTDTHGAVIVTLAHEALITSWDRAKRWLADNKDFLRLKARIGDAGRRWREENRDAAFLLAEGKPLAESEDALRHRRSDLDRAEIEFVEASSSYAVRRRRRGRLKAVGILTGTLTLIFGSITVVQVQKQRDARRATSETDAALAADYLQKNNVRLALAYLGDALRNNRDNEKAAGLALSILRDSPLPRKTFHHADEVQDIAFSPDGERLVTASADGTGALWNPHATDNKPIAVLPHKPGIWVHSAAFSRDSKWVVTGSYDGTAREWDGKTGRPRLDAKGQPIVLRHPGNVAHVAFSPDGQQIATACWDDNAYVWNAETGDAVATLPHQNTVWTVEFSQDGNWLATASEDGYARLWKTTHWTADPVALKHVANPKPGDTSDENKLAAVNSAQFSQDSKSLVTAADDGLARVWSITTRRVTLEVAHKLAVSRASFSPDARWVVTASSDNTVRITEVATKQSLPAIRHQGWVREARFSPDGRLVATASADGTARIWNARTAEPVSSAMYHGSAVYAIAFSSDGRSLATASFDHTGRIWTVLGSDLGKAMVYQKAVNSAKFSPDGSLIVTASDDGFAQLWDVKAGGRNGAPLLHGTTPVIFATFSPALDRSPAMGRLVTITGDGNARIWHLGAQPEIGATLSAPGATFAQFSPDGRWLAIVTKNTKDNVTRGVARVWDAQTGTPKSPELSHDNEIMALGFNHDGSRVYTACNDGKGRAWVVATGKVEREFPHNGAVKGIAFGHFGYGDRVVTASADHTARIWDAATGQPVGAPLQQDNWIYDAEFSPDGQRVVTASSDGTARVWDAQNGRPISGPMRHANAVFRAMFSSEGRWVLTASWDGTARVWDAQTGQPISIPLGQRDKMTDAMFSPDGRRFITAGVDGAAHVWEVPLYVPTAPDWLADLVEDVGGLHLDARRNVTPTTEDADEFRRKFSALNGPDELSRFARWLVADPAERTITPVSNLTVPEFVTAQLRAGDAESVRAAYFADPGNRVIATKLNELERAEAAAVAVPGAPKS